MSEPIFSPVPLGPRAEDDDLRAAVECAAEDLARRWQTGERPLAEEYFARSPALLGHPEAALELIAEEVAVRQEHGVPARPSELAARFPAWRAQVAALLDCQRVLAPNLAVHRFPQAGTALGEFRLLAELGRGVNGRVFLAAQPALAGRWVVLKLAPNTGREHLSLARLQHTHIVPLYSAHEFADRGLRGLCLPYFGGATLSALLTGLRQVPPTRRTGRHLLETLVRAELAAPVSLPVEGPACRFLARASYTQAVCWLGACLADALQYAHDHGLLHLDLKPSNVLFAADGQPMLLDFHLARAPIQAGTAPPTWIGGTPGYMPPEQRAALDAVRAGLVIPAPVDGRADVFALGRLLREALGCAAPEGLAPRLVPGLERLLRRCTDERPDNRYRAGELAADLRRHLADLPLKGVAERSLSERWRKWRRRRPSALPLIGVLATALASAAASLIHAERLADRARIALHDAEQLLNERRYAEAAEAAKRGEALADGILFNRGLLARAHEAGRAAERGRAALELHQFCEAVRPLYNADAVPTAQVQAVVVRCRQLWEQRERLVAELLPPVGAPDGLARTDLLDLAIVLARLESRLASGERPGRARALEVLDQAESLLGAGRTLYEERASYARPMARTDLAASAARVTGAPPPASAFEHLAVGRARLMAGDLEAAAELLGRAIELEPQSLWANYFLGVCALRRGEADRAAAAFSACVALAPRSAWCLYNRGLAYARLGRTEWAARDFGHARDLDPSQAAASVALADLHRRAGRFPEAVAELRRAREAGAAPAVLSYQQALIHLARGNRLAALAALRQALTDESHHAGASALTERITSPRR